MTAEDPIFAIATAPRRDSEHWEQSEITLSELIGWLDTPADHKECGNYVLGTLRPTGARHRPGSDPCPHLHRNKAAIVSRSVITLDVDHPEDDFLDRLRAWGVHAAWHTTYKSTLAEPRYRVWVFVDRELAPDEYHTAAASIMQKLGEEQFDPGSVQPERYMFRPSYSDRAAYAAEHLPGPEAEAEELLRDFNADLSALPAPRPHKNKRDPFTIEGPIGAFNRVYEDWSLLISEYDLPYEPAGADRWGLVGASAAAGMSPVAPGLVYSHHANDPAYGQTCSAFDLVRVHLYSELDDAASPGTPVNRLPSHQAMLETATQDARVVAELVGHDFVAEMAGVAADVDADAGVPTPASSWRMGLSLSARTGKPNDTIDNWDLISNHDPVFSALFYNELSMAIEVDRDLPWRALDDRPTFDVGDRSSFALHIEREYGIRPARAYLDDLINDRARRHRVNPVREYLEGLSWDGIPRLEECLPGVRPTPYTRLVARKVMVAAVARMLDPGCKWDHMLVIYGTEGLGKSYWIDRMARGYSASLGRIGDKDTLITMQRSWIMTSDEGHSLRKADFDVQKEFLTKTADIFRMPYDREALVHRRHCVIWGTTNDEVFLRRQEGNRRFLIVRSTEHVDFAQLTDEYVDQVWAEALALYRAGEPLWLDDAEAALAEAQREDFIEEDALTGQISEYLERLVPAGWDEMAPEARQLWLMNAAEGFQTGTEQITRVCSVQVWVEALGRRYGDHRRVDLLEINNALKQLPGWRQVPGRQRVPGYGPQQVFIRDTEDLL